jgi:hypothetical protein
MLPRKPLLPLLLPPLLAPLPLLRRQDRRLHQQD